MLKRYPAGVDESLRQRLEHELKTIEDMGFVSYFLIVWDFINYAKSIGVPVVPAAVLPPEVWSVIFWDH